MGSHGWGHKGRGHRRFGEGQGGHNRGWRRGYDDDQTDPYSQPEPYGDNGYRADDDWRSGGRATRLRAPWTLVLIGLVVWSGLAWMAYQIVDPVLTWIAANAGLLAQSGNVAATAAGGEAAGALLGQIDVSTLLGQVLALLAALAKPLIALLWLLGAAALLVAPLVLPRLGRRLLSRRH